MAAISCAISMARVSAWPVGATSLISPCRALRRAEHPAGHQQQHGAFAADQPRSFCVPRARQNSDLDLGQAEARALAGHDDVGAQRQLQPPRARSLRSRRSRLGQSPIAASISARCAPSPRPPAPAISPMSAPAAKAASLPVMTMQRMSGRRRTG